MPALRRVKSDAWLFVRSKTKKYSSKLLTYGGFNCDVCHLIHLHACISWSCICHYVVFGMRFQKSKGQMEAKRQEVCDRFVCLPFKKASQEGCSLIIAVLIEKFCLLQWFLIRPWCSCPDILRTVVFLPVVFMMLMTHDYDHDVDMVFHGWR